MGKTYTPATFQPTVRPSWAGILSYISEKERSDILEAIIKYPNDTGIDSKFWQETIKPDLDEQYDKFLKICEVRGRSAKTYWGEHKLSISNTKVKQKDNLLKDKVKDKDKDKDKDNILTNLNNILNINNKNKVVISSCFKASDCDELKVYVQEMPEDVIHSVEQWLINTKLGQAVDCAFIAKQFINFAKRQGRPFFKEV